jgi:hypothetical protein
MNGYTRSNGDQDSYAPRGLGPNGRGPGGYEFDEGPRGLGPRGRTAPDQPEPPQVEPTEKYSAQVLRRLHNDAQILMSEYDEMLGPLEHDGIREHVMAKLQKLTSELEAIEGLVRQHHPEITLDGTMGPGF